MAHDGTALGALKEIIKAKDGANLIVTADEPIE